jgi:hypothetical protein
MENNEVVSGKSNVEICLGDTTEELRLVELILSGAREGDIPKPQRDRYAEIRDLYGDGFIPNEEMNFDPESEWTFAFTDYLNDEALETVVLAELSIGNTEWQVKGARLLLACGGPTIWMTVMFDGPSKIEVYWSNNSAIEEVSYPSIAAELEELFNCYDFG